MVTTARPARGRRSCKVCALPASERRLIEGASRAGWGARCIAARFSSIRRADVAAHAKKCVSGNRTEEEGCER